jgi:hypothetical protein
LDICQDSFWNSYQKQLFGFLLPKIELLYQLKGERKLKYGANSIKGLQS